MTTLLKTDLYAGRPADVVLKALLGPAAGFDAGDADGVIAALAGVGSVGEAEVLLRGQAAVMTDEQLVFAHVHIAMASAYAGRYATARRHLGRAARLRNATAQAESLFFLYFGLAQYRFVTGRLKLALMEAHRAGAFLKRSGRTGSSDDSDGYAGALWHDLLGHLQALTGDPRGGLVHLETAQRQAETLGRHGQAQTLATSRVLYEARYARKPKDAVALLRSHLAGLEPDEALAQVSLHLELCRQQLLRRRHDDARAALDAAVLTALARPSRRYEVIACLRLVDLHLASGSLTEALLTLQATEHRLDPEGDDLLALDLSARRAAVLERLVDPRRASPVVSQSLAAARRRHAQLERRTGYVRPNDPKLRVKPPSPGLNHRQVALLTDLAEREAVDVQVYKKAYNVSEITACRDLAALVRGGYLERLGKARATRYVKTPPPNPGTPGR